jgi:cytidylate kinase
MRRITIAIDGYSSCGKSTLAKHLAHHLHYTYIDSGAMYRAVALYALENGLIKQDKLDLANLLRVLPGIHIGFKHDDASQRSETWLDGRNVEHRIREMDVSHNVTLVSPVPEVRAKLVQLQQHGRAGRGRGDGRPRHRYGRIPERRSEVLHDRQSGSARQPPLHGTQRPWGGSDLGKRAGQHRPPRYG